MYSGEMSAQDVHELLELLHDRYNRPEFIDSDPVSLPRRYTLKEDAEIAGFLTATISWGNRKSILQSASRMLGRMGDSPFDYVMQASTGELNRMDGAIHRTFQSVDLRFFILSLRAIYTRYDGLESLFTKAFRNHCGAAGSIHEVRGVFLQTPHEQRSEKHFADPLAGSSAKRINMFLRWMVRNDGRGVDLGLWKDIPMSVLSIPLDVHSGHTAREIGLLKRTASDARAVEELDEALRKYDAIDPVRYDYALFGAGVEKKEMRL